MRLLHEEAPTHPPREHVLARIAAGLRVIEGAALLRATKPEGENDFLGQSLAILGARMVRADSADDRPQTVMNLKVHKLNIPFFPDSIRGFADYVQLALRGVQIAPVGADGDVNSYFVFFRSAKKSGMWLPVLSPDNPAKIVVAQYDPKEQLDHDEFARMV